MTQKLRVHILGDRVPKYGITVWALHKGWRLVYSFADNDRF